MITAAGPCSRYHRRRPWRRRWPLRADRSAGRRSTRQRYRGRPVRRSGSPPGKTLKYGAKGSVVKALQARLKELGYMPGKVDGRYGGAHAERRLGLPEGQRHQADQHRRREDVARPGEPQAPQGAGADRQADPRRGQPVDPDPGPVREGARSSSSPHISVGQRRPLRRVRHLERHPPEVQRRRTHAHRTFTRRPGGAPAGTSPTWASSTTPSSSTAASPSTGAVGPLPGVPRLRASPDARRAGPPRLAGHRRARSWPCAAGSSADPVS